MSMQAKMVLSTSCAAQQGSRFGDSAFRWLTGLHTDASHI
jgi:hypothetical protein